jgi:hypothetical protein
MAFVAAIRVRKRNREFQMWIPLLLLWLMLLPVVLLLVPVFLVACCVGRVDPFVALLALWRIFTGLRGTEVEFARPSSTMLVRIL